MKYLSRLKELFALAGRVAEIVRLQERLAALEAVARYVKMIDLGHLVERIDILDLDVERICGRATMLTPGYADMLTPLQIAVLKVRGVEADAGAYYTAIKALQEHVAALEVNFTRIATVPKATEKVGL